MSEAQQQAVRLAQFYFRKIAESSGWTWDGDNDTEVEMMVSFAIDAAADQLRGQLADALERIRVLERAQAAAQITAPPPEDSAKCPDHRPVLDSALGWYCAACGSDAPPVSQGGQA